MKFSQTVPNSSATYIIIMFEVEALCHTVKFMFQAKGDTLINLCVSYILSKSIEMPSKRSLVNKKYMPCDMQGLQWLYLYSQQIFQTHQLFMHLYVTFGKCSVSIILYPTLSLRIAYNIQGVQLLPTNPKSQLPNFLGITTKTQNGAVGVYIICQLPVK